MKIKYPWYLVQQFLVQRFLLFKVLYQFVHLFN